MVASDDDDVESSRTSSWVTSRLSSLVRESLNFALEPLGGQWKDALFSYIDGNGGVEFTHSGTSSIAKLKESIERVCGVASELVYIRMSLFLSKKNGVDVSAEELKDIDYVFDKVAREVLARESVTIKGKSWADKKPTAIRENVPAKSYAPFGEKGPASGRLASSGTKQPGASISRVDEAKADLDSGPLIFISGADRAAFEDQLLKSCDETLEILGKSVVQSTYHWLKVNYGIEREEIPENFPKFIKAVQSIYGFGARVIMIGLATTLCKQFNLEGKFDLQDPDLNELLKILRECQTSMATRTSI